MHPGGPAAHFGCATAHALEQTASAAASTSTEPSATTVSHNSGGHACGAGDVPWHTRRSGGAGERWKRRAAHVAVGLDAADDRVPEVGPRFAGVQACRGHHHALGQRLRVEQRVQHGQCALESQLTDGRSAAAGRRGRQRALRQALHVRTGLILHAAMPTTIVRPNIRQAGPGNSDLLGGGSRPRVAGGQWRCDAWLPHMHTVGEQGRARVRKAVICGMICGCGGGPCS